jgi:tRNA uridine 5-carboxymethylaminomethyl modification enzyme
MADLKSAIAAEDEARFEREVWESVLAERKYEPYVERQRLDIERRAEMEHRRLPAAADYRAMTSMRNEAREALARFRPATFGQAGRLEGITPADLTLLSVLLRKAEHGGRDPRPSGLQ